MPGLVPGIHVFTLVGPKDVDGRDKPGHDERARAALTLSRRSEKILLGNIDTGMAQDVVGRRDMKEELRNAERQQQRFAGEFSLGAVLESESDFLVGCGVDLGARQALHEIDRR